MPTDTTDPYHLQRFLDAQQPVYPQVCAELRAGAKRTHWMWFIFPQIAGLGSSAMAIRYAISGLDEARAYAGHAVLGARLTECTRLVTATRSRTITQIFGGIDAAKFRSCMTLFAHAAPGNQDFRDALDKYFAGEADALTLGRL